MTIEQIIDEINRRGARVNNLCQIGDGWRANVVCGDTAHEFAFGATAEDFFA
jgi:hypothetical protein